MTLREALVDSKETGNTFVSSTGGGFVRWCDETVYEFTAEQLVADDWEDVKTGIPRMTGGRWRAAE